MIYSTLSKQSTLYIQRSLILTSGLFIMQVACIIITSLISLRTVFKATSSTQELSDFLSIVIILYISVNLKTTIYLPNPDRIVA